MKYTEIAGRKLSAMSLGTVQLGMNYGIANTGGKPDETKSFAMLNAAMEKGITSLDTAFGYGDSEEVLGRFFRQYNGELPFVTTKLLGIQGNTAAQVEKCIIEAAETSLSRLGLKKVDCILLHRANNLYDNGQWVADAMAGLVKRGYTDMVGASVYTGEELSKMLEYDVYTATQIPMSVFDQRLITAGLTDKLYERNIVTFVRSVFLQGLFFLDPDKIQDPVLKEHAAPKIRLLRQCAQEEGMSVAQLAISYMRDVRGVTSLVLGADTPEQVMENARYFETKTVSEKTAALLKRAFADVNIPAIMGVLSRAK